MTGDIIIVTFAGFAVGAVCMALANLQVTAEAARARWLKLVVFFLIVHAVLGIAVAGRTWVTVLLLLILVTGGVELWRAWRRIPAHRPLQVWFVYVTVAIASTCSTWLLPPAAFAFLFLVTAACDGFSQVVGQLIGRRKLAPSISPGKTVGGFAGGLAAALVVGLLARDLLGAAPGATAGIAAAAGVAGLAGDLAASWVKRRAGIKDYSAALPGQGGFLDRFDSLLGALALIGPALVVGAG